MFNLADWFTWPRTGTQVIDDICNKFEKIQFDLEEGVELVDGDLETNRVDIARLRERQSNLNDTKSKALNVISGLKQLFGVSKDEVGRTDG